jgi:hypothetical protein
MKINPIPNGNNLGNVEVGQPHSKDRVDAAKAAFLGQEAPVKITESDNYVDPQVAKAKESIRKIKMKTNASPLSAQDLASVEVEQSVISDITEQVQATTEETKPLSPQFAALAKQRRALQVKEREIADREKALATKNTSSEDVVSKAKIKSDPLSVLQEAGVSYDELTQAILATPVNPEIQALKEEIRALKEGVDGRFTTQAEAQEEAALTEMLVQAEILAKEGDAYEMIRERNAYDQVLRKIYTTYKKTGQVLDVEEVMGQIENQLLDESLKLAGIKKVQSKLVPKEPEVQQQQQFKSIKTLTSRDNARPVLDRKARALAAFHGTLKGK